MWCLVGALVLNAARETIRGGAPWVLPVFTKKALIPLELRPLSLKRGMVNASRAKHHQPVSWEAQKLQELGRRAPSSPPLHFVTGSWEMKK